MINKTLVSRLPSIPKRVSSLLKVFSLWGSAKKRWSEIKEIEACCVAFPGAPSFCPIFRAAPQLAERLILKKIVKLTASVIS